MIDICLSHCYHDNYIVSVITMRCITIIGYEDIDESKMDDIPSNTQNACFTPPPSPPPPPPPPPRSGKQEQNVKASTNPHLNIAKEDDGDEVSGYEYVSNPMKVDNRKTSNECNERATDSVEIHHNQHTDNSAPDGALDTASHHDKGGKQIDTHSAYEENDDTKEGQLSFHSNVCSKSMNMNRDKTGLKVPHRHGQCSCDICSMQTDSDNIGILSCRGKSVSNEVKCDNMEKSKREDLETDGYQKLIRETMSSKHAYQKLAKATMGPRVLNRQCSIPDLVLQQSMEYSDRKNQSNDGYQKRTKGAICSVHEYQKLNRQTMEPYGYMPNVRYKHATI